MTLSQFQKEGHPLLLEVCLPLELGTQIKFWEIMDHNQDCVTYGLWMWALHEHVSGEVKSFCGGVKITLLRLVSQLLSASPPESVVPAKSHRLVSVWGHNSQCHQLTVVPHTVRFTTNVHLKTNVNTAKLTLETYLLTQIQSIQSSFFFDWVEGTYSVCMHISGNTQLSAWWLV